MTDARHTAPAPRPTAPQPTAPSSSAGLPQQQQVVVPPQPTATKTADDGLGHLLPSSSDQKAIGFYDNEWHDAVI